MRTLAKFSFSAPLLLCLAVGCHNTSPRIAKLRATLTGVPIVIREGEPIHGRLVIENTGNVPFRIPNQRVTPAYAGPVVLPLFAPPIKYERSWPIELDEGDADTLSPGQRVSRFVELAPLRDAWVYLSGLAISGTRPLGEREFKHASRMLLSGYVWIVVIPSADRQSVHASGP